MTVCIRDTNGDEYVVVDLDTGTVLGTNVVAVKLSDLTSSELAIIDGTPGATDDDVYRVAVARGTNLLIEGT